MARGRLPAPDPDGAGEGGPRENAGHVVTEGGFAVYTKVATDEGVAWEDAEAYEPAGGGAP